MLSGLRYDARMTQPDLPFHPADEARGARPLIVAELGVNHNGRLERAQQLIAAAAEAGANAIKLQYFDPDRLLSRDAQLAGYQKNNAAGPHQLLETRRLSLETMHSLQETAHANDLAFIVTPFSIADCEELGELALDAIKIASPDAVNAPLLEAARDLMKPMLISTGTCTVDELQPAATLLRGHPPDGALLHCVSSYPTATHDAALGGIAALRSQFELPTGYSDHTTAIVTGGLAVAAGACILEKHLTYDRRASGPDHATSLDPGQFRQYVEQARQAASMVGPLYKTPLAVEQEVAAVARQSVCATRDLPAGRRIEPGDLTVKRPGIGIPAHAVHDVIGKTLTRAIEANTIIQWDDIA